MDNNTKLVGSRRTAGGLSFLAVAALAFGLTACQEQVELGLDAKSSAEINALSSKIDQLADRLERAEKASGRGNGGTAGVSPDELRTQINQSSAELARQLTSKLEKLEGRLSTLESSSVQGVGVAGEAGEVANPAAAAAAIERIIEQREARLAAEKAEQDRIAAEQQRIERRKGALDALTNRMNERATELNLTPAQITQATDIATRRYDAIATYAATVREARAAGREVPAEEVRAEFSRLQEESNASLSSVLSQEQSDAIRRDLWRGDASAIADAFEGQRGGMMFGAGGGAPGTAPGGRGGFQGRGAEGRGNEGGTRDGGGAPRGGRGGTRGGGSDSNAEGF